MKHLQKRSFKGAGLVLLIFLSSGLVLTCQPKQKPQQETSFEKWREKAEVSKGHSPSPRKLESTTVKEETIAPVPERSSLPAKELPADKISLSMYNVDLQVLLRTLARSANLNIIVSDKIQGRTSLKIENTPWNQVFTSILRSNWLDYTWEGEILRITTLEDKDKSIKTLEAEQQMKAKQREIETVEPLITRVIRIDYADAGKLRGNLEKFLTQRADGKPIGSVMVDEHTNSLILMAMKGDIAKITSIVQDLDKPTPQILIEAQIVEATKEIARQLGIQWGGLYHGTDSGKNFWITPGANSSGSLGGSVDTAIDPKSGQSVNFPAVLGDTGFTLGFVSQDIGNYILNVQLSALQREGKLNILSSPSITTIDNQKALIESGKEVPYQTVVDNDVKIEFKKAVLSLEVVPHVIDGRTIKLNISTKKDELDFANAVQGQPAITTKRAETNVILLDGQTTVIGGLSKENINDSESGVPYLKDIPVLGWLFKGTDTGRDKEEVLIFITPHILKEKQTATPSS